MLSTINVLVLLDNIIFKFCRKESICIFNFIAFIYNKISYRHNTLPLTFIASKIVPQTIDILN